MWDYTAIKNAGAACQASSIISESGNRKNTLQDARLHDQSEYRMLQSVSGPWHQVYSATLQHLTCTGLHMHFKHISIPSCFRYIIHVHLNTIKRESSLAFTPSIFLENTHACTCRRCSAYNDYGYQDQHVATSKQA